MKECPGTSGNKNCRNPCFFIKIFCTFQKRSDRLFLTLDNLLHESITNHEVSCGGVFVKKKKVASGFHAFYDTGCLGSASTGIQCRETAGIFLVWKIIYKHGNIHILDKTAIF